MHLSCTVVPLFYQLTKTSILIDKTPQNGFCFRTNSEMWKQRPGQRSGCAVFGITSFISAKTARLVADSVCGNDGFPIMLLHFRRGANNSWNFFFLSRYFFFLFFVSSPPNLSSLSLSLVIFLQIHNKYTSLEIISIILTASVVHYLLSITCVMNWHWWPGKYFMEVQIFVSFPLAVLSIYSPCHILPE